LLLETEEALFKLNEWIHGWLGHPWLAMNITRFTPAGKQTQT
jgi:hypothetical protein